MRNVLLHYIESLQKQGRYLFDREKARQELGVSHHGVSSSLKRLAQKGKIGYLKKSLYQIIPLSYENQGSLPPEWFIDELMRHLDIPYYVSLLSAAAWHGAAHQAPQIFQVMCPQTLRPLRTKGMPIHFYQNQCFSLMPTQSLKTPAGYVHVATPESTAFDLVRYMKVSGHIHHVATILGELAEKINGNKLATISPSLSVRESQRLGYILDYLGYSSLTQALHERIMQKKTVWIPLRPDQPLDHGKRDERWHIIVNETIETDI